MSDALPLLRNEALLIAIVGGVFGSLATLAGTIVIEWFRAWRRRRQLRRALVAALASNVRQIDARENRRGDLPMALDLLVLDATAASKYELLPVTECEAVDAARTKLRILEPIEDLLAAREETVSAMIGDPMGKGGFARRIFANRELHGQLPVLLSEARGACDAALVALRGRGEPKPVETAKPAKPASAADVAGATAE